MKQKIILTLAALTFAIAALAGGGRLTIPLPLRSTLVIPSWAIDSVRDMSTVYVRSEWVIDRFLHVEVVTDGIQINWIGETPWWAVSPEPNAYLPYNFKLESYCRFIPFGENDNPQWECVSRLTERGILYQRFDFEGGIWGRRLWRFDRMVGQ